MTIAELILPLVRPHPVAWIGLPPISAAGFDGAFGPPAAIAEAHLGYYPAERRLYRWSGADIILWARAGRAVMVETPLSAAASALSELEEPCAVLAHEILLPDAYAHEYLFCSRGLAATVAEPHTGGDRSIVRLRGFAPIASPDHFGPEYYKAFEDQVLWGAQ